MHARWMRPLANVRNAFPLIRRALDARIRVEDNARGLARQGGRARRLLPQGAFLIEPEQAGEHFIVGEQPGAEIIATGHVIVWGRLRGLVHAGAGGDAAAIICALDLSPTQLRIADHIAVAPDSGPGRAPEQAAIRDGQIVAEPWSARHGG